MKKLILAALIAATTTATAKEIALTFDDSPRETGTLMTGMQRAQKLTDILKQNNVKQAAFFCNSPLKTPDGPQRLKHFADAGHVIANHSATHPDLDKTPTDKYQQDIATADQQLKNYPNFRKWFRYPFLHEGKTESKRDALRKYLRTQGYLNGYVTIDNNDWYMDSLLGQAVKAGKKINEAELCAAYRDVMKDEILFNDDISTKVLGRSVKHVLLLHETDLNALCLATVISWLRESGWNIITADEAFADPISQREPDTLLLGQGRVVALAKEKGYAGPFFSKWNEESAMDGEFLRRRDF